MWAKKGKHRQKGILKTMNWYKKKYKSGIKKSKI